MDDASDSIAFLERKAGLIFDPQNIAVLECSSSYFPWVVNYRVSINCRLVVNSDTILKQRVEDVRWPFWLAILHLY
jgi:hypothetical protein